MTMLPTRYQNLNKEVTLQSLTSHSTSVIKKDIGDFPTYIYAFSISFFVVPYRDCIWGLHTQIQLLL